MSLLQKLNQALEDDKIHVSFEYFAPKTQKGMGISQSLKSNLGINSLNNRICRMKYWNPLWIDVTWGAGGKSGGQTMKICHFAKKFGGLEVNMHLTCTNMPKSKIDQALKFCKENNIYNILALRGDKPVKTEGLQEGHFAHATDLVEYIRKQYGDTFCISVAGYPEVHPQSNGMKQDIKWLKEKINKGADFIITQLFLDSKDFIQYVKLCREEGIKCPIIPGVMPFVSYNNYQMVIKLSSIKVPVQLDQMIQAAKDNDQLIKKIGIDWALKIIHQLEAVGMKFYHIYTMNQEYSTDEILKSLNLIYSEKEYPFMKHQVGDRKEEAVRPIFWANRQFSYIERTKDWDEFPNGRWGKSGEASFSLQESYPSFGRNLKNKKQREQLCKFWGEAPMKLEDICLVFVQFLEGKIPQLPWNQLFSQIKQETKLIEEGLLKLNINGFLTTNSQPRINGLPSNDKTVGWGHQGGYIYQKQYLEFFCPSKIVNLLINEMKNHKSITYQAINIKNEELRNCEKNSVNAVTWGVFPGQELQQPTVVDHETFLVWKQEAFSLWINEWKAIYQSNSPSARLIQKIHDDFFLVNLCDNDYVHGNLFKIVQGFIDSNQETIKDVFKSFIEKQ